MVILNSNNAVFGICITTLGSIYGKQFKMNVNGFFLDGFGRVPNTSFPFYPFLKTNELGSF